ncbi:MAG: DMT family transporter [Gammaproteobacteria bacterium]
MKPGILLALIAAVLFGAGTPFAKLLLGHTAPVLLAGLLYAGSGVGLTAWLAFRHWRSRGKFQAAQRWTRTEMLWLTAATLIGGAAGPALLMAGLVVTPASTASLLLNMEGVFTVLLAWFVFRENFDRHILVGMICIVVASGLLAWPERMATEIPWGIFAVVGACLCWALDNNLTRKVSAHDPVVIAALKGLVAGGVNIPIAMYLFGARWPAWSAIVGTGFLGLISYGLSLVLFVLALRNLGTARTSAYFSTAPFIGAIIALLLFRQNPSLMFWPAAVLMGVGVWLHLREKHEHLHVHECMRHTHSHVHDEHHQHRHDFDWDGKEPHTHEHEHKPLVHSHPHYPDIHHRHAH